jgi:hypothetical protein
MEWHLSESHHYIIGFLTLYIRDDAAFHGSTVYGNALYALLCVVGYHLDIVGAFPELPGQGEITKALGNTGIDA